MSDFWKSKKACTIVVANTLVILLLIHFFRGPHTFLPNSSQLSTPAPATCLHGDIKQIEEDLYKLDQMSPTLIGYTRVKYLTPPSKLDYNLEMNDTKKSKTYLTDWVLKFFGEGYLNGTFIEAGAFTGEQHSNTLYLEIEMGWTGLLVECNPRLFTELKRKHRKAWITDVCLSPSSNPSYMNFTNPIGYDVAGTLAKPLFVNPKSPMHTFDVQTIPLYTLIAALGWEKIDYLSLDVEGTELEIIKHFPWDKVTFNVVSIEIQAYNKVKLQELRDRMIINGYNLVEKLPIDDIFVHRSAIKQTAS